MKHFTDSFSASQLDWETEILAQWDRLEPFPPIPLWDFGYARARLTAFRSTSAWFTVFEITGFDAGSNLCMNYLFGHGNRLRRTDRGLRSYEMLTASARSSNYPFFDEDDEGNVLIDPLNFDFRSGTREYHLEPSPEEYAQLGIDLHVKVAGEIDSIVKILRFLTYTYPEIVFLSPTQLLAMYDQPEDLKPFVQTFDWKHPDYRLHEKPSDSECLRSLATAIAQNDVSVFTCAEELVNTHWQNWPEWPQ